VKIFGSKEVETCADPTLQNPASTRDLVCNELTTRSTTDTWISVVDCVCGDPKYKEY